VDTHSGHPFPSPRNPTSEARNYRLAESFVLSIGKMGEILSGPPLKEPPDQEDRRREILARLDSKQVLAGIPWRKEVPLHIIRRLLADILISAKRMEIAYFGPS
jgi:hypothetical protein